MAAAQKNAVGQHPVDSYLRELTVRFPALPAELTLPAIKEAQAKFLKLLGIVCCIALA